MDLRSIFVSAHSGIRWIVVLLGIIALLRFLIGWLRGDEYGDLETTIWKALNMTVTLQFVLGVIVLIWGAVSSFGSAWLQVAGEHAFINIIAIAILGMASSRARKGTVDKQRFMTSAIGVIVAAILIFIAIGRVSGWS